MNSWEKFLKQVAFPWGTPKLDTRLEIPEVPDLPAPGPDQLGKIIRYRDDKKTKIYVCVINSAGNHEWIQLAESS